MFKGYYLFHQCVYYVFGTSSGASLFVNKNKASSVEFTSVPQVFFDNFILRYVLFDLFIVETVSHAQPFISVAAECWNRHGTQFRAAWNSNIVLNSLDLPQMGERNSSATIWVAKKW